MQGSAELSDRRQVPNSSPSWEVGGITPRGLIDCMIASIAIRTGAELLAADQDFADMARILPLQLA